MQPPASYVQFKLYVTIQRAVALGVAYLTISENPNWSNPIRRCRTEALPGTPSQPNACGRRGSMWKQNGDRVLAELGSAALNDAVIAATGRAETLELGHRHGHLSPLVNVA